MLIRKEQSNAERGKPRRRTPIHVTSWSASGTDLTLTFNQPVGLNGLPAYSTDVMATPVSAVQTDPLTIVITFSADISIAATLTIPFQDPAIRNKRGGFVTSLNVAA